jgi:large subunit ribosomal protein L30
MKIAIVRVRGVTGVNRNARETMEQLHLNRKHSCVVLEETDTVKGMLKTAKDFVTWGPANEETVKKLEAKGKPPYRLHPPVKGWGGSIKKAFPKGALGKRGEKINELIERML